MFPSISLESCHAFNREDRISFHVASFLRMDASSRTEIREGYRSKPLSYSNSRNVANYRRRIAVEIANTGGRCPINFFLSLFSSIRTVENLLFSSRLLIFLPIPPLLFSSRARFVSLGSRSFPFHSFRPVFSLSLHLLPGFENLASSIPFVVFFHTVTQFHTF